MCRRTRWFGASASADRDSACAQFGRVVQEMVRRKRRAARKPPAARRASKEVRDMVAWCDIIAECGNYKTGFVATFRRYEGEPTDERDARGRVVKVTRTSFAEHMGIPVNTFHRWVQYVTVTESVSQEARQARTAVSHANVVKNMAKNDPRAFADAVLSAGTSASDQAFHELKLRRAGVD